MIPGSRESARPGRTASSLRLGELVCRFAHGFCDQQRLLLIQGEILDAFGRGQREHHDLRLVFRPAGGEGGHEIGRGRALGGLRHSCVLLRYVENYFTGTKAVTSISTFARASTSPEM